MEEVVEYKYDTWGRVIGMEGSDYGKWVGSLNPFRYRGYYYDDETGMYYLITRYYNPEWGRFLNADGDVAAGVNNSTNNLYAYCSNNPVNFADPNGNSAIDYRPGTIYVDNGDELLCFPTNKPKENKNKKTVDITSTLLAEMRANYQILADGVNESIAINSIKNALIYGPLPFILLGPIPAKLTVLGATAIETINEEFVQKVKTGGVWDLKSKAEWQPAEDETYVFMGKEVTPEDIGNIHYGYVGRAIFPTEILCMGAGAYQIYSGTWDEAWGSTYFDDPKDTANIRWGAQLFDEGY